MDNSLSNLPKKKAKLEETRHLLKRLEEREGDVSSDRYQRLRERYKSQIDSLEVKVSELTDRGETRKMELEDRMALKREKKQGAENELAEIESLHAQRALDDETYRNQKRNYRRQAKKGEKSIQQLEQELDELQYYLNEVGEEPYRSNTLKGKFSQIGSRLGNLTSGSGEDLGAFVSDASAEARNYGENIKARLNNWASNKGGRMQRKKQKKRGIILTTLGTVLLLVGIAGMAIKGSLEAEMHNNLQMQMRMMFDQETRQKATAATGILSAVGTGGLVLGAILLIAGLVLLFSLPAIESKHATEEVVTKE